MNKKKTFGILLAYVFIIFVLPMGLISNTVNAAEIKTSSPELFTNYKVLSSQILNTAVYPDYSVVNTNYKLLTIKNGQATLKGTYSSFEPMNYIGRNGNYLYLRSSLYYESNYVKYFYANSGKYLGYQIPLNYWTTNTTAGTVDNSGNQWFSTIKYTNNGTKEYYLLRESAKNSDNYSLLKLPAQYYKINKLTTDSKDNIWFTNYNNKLYKASYDSAKKQFSLKTYDLPLKNYYNLEKLLVDNNGDVWVQEYTSGLQSNLIQLRDTNGKLKIIKEFKNMSIRDFTIDKNGSVWTLSYGDSNKHERVSKLDSSKFVDKYIVSSYMTTLSVYNDNHMLLNGNYGYTLIEKNLKPTVSISVKGGLYKNKQTVSLNSSADSIIYYTLDGSTPTTKSPKYTKPIAIEKNTVLKYIAVDIFGTSSNVSTEQYSIVKNK